MNVYISINISVYIYVYVDMFMYVNLNTLMIRQLYNKHIFIYHKTISRSSFLISLMISYIYTHT
jgi:hypothetical protein